VRIHDLRHFPGHAMKSFRLQLLRPSRIDGYLRCSMDAQLVADIKSIAAAVKSLASLTSASAS
jgi:hypothetical protein